jgi:hypothetical protein
VSIRRCVVKTWLEEVELLSEHLHCGAGRKENKGYKVHVATAHLLIGIR